jgi:hypothetical protein
MCLKVKETMRECKIKLWIFSIRNPRLPALTLDKSYFQVLCSPHTDMTILCRPMHCKYHVSFTLLRTCSVSCRSQCVARAISFATGFSLNVAYFKLLMAHKLDTHLRNICNGRPKYASLVFKKCSLLDHTIPLIDPPPSNHQASLTDVAGPEVARHDCLAWSAKSRGARLLGKGRAASERAHCLP